MPGTYNPSDDAATQPPWDVAFLSQRDVAFEIPINFVTVPGVSLRAACFARNSYEDSAASVCISNLLSMGIKRLIVDVYWDAGRALWSLCPAELLESASPEDDSAVPPAPTSISTADLASVILSENGNAAVATNLEDQDARLARKQVDSKSSLASAQTTSTMNIQFSSSTNPSTLPAATGTPNPEDQDLVQIGPYSCTATTGLSLLTDVLLGYFTASETNLDVDLTLLQLNIHAAAPSSSPSSPAREVEPSQLPSGNNLLSGLLNAQLSSYLYTPPMLQADRSNLNQSWFEVPGRDEPIVPYFQTSSNEESFSTPDGWPSQAFTDFRRFIRLIAAIGEVDPQMSDYNFTGDSETIFPASSVFSPRDVSVGDAGSISSGCFYDSSVTSVTTMTNNSWALSSQIPLGQSATLTNDSTSLIAELAACGISSYLNDTLQNQTADIDPIPYRDFSNAATVWSWASGEPKNASLELSAESTDWRCAALYPSSGRWYPTDCSERLYAACRIDDQPYLWTLSDDPSTFSNLVDRCPENSSFAVPRTGLENAYLLAAIGRGYLEKEHNDHNKPVFLNFQSLDHDSCWVVGVDTACPYRDQTGDDLRTRNIIVPTVGAVIIFTLAVLMVFIKCASNRSNVRSGRCRRTGGDRGDYEGVPS